MLHPMVRMLLLGCVVAASALIARAPLAADAAPAAPLASAAQIVERNVEARGGLRAWRAVNAMSLSGQVESGGKSNATLPIVIELKRPLKTRVEVQFEDKAAPQVFDGVSGWKLLPYLGRDDVEPFSADEMREAAAQSELDGPLIDYAVKGTQITFEGVEAVEGHDAYRLKLAFRGGATRRVWVDAKSFLEVKIEGMPHRLDGRPRRVETFFRDYRKVDGLLVPFVVETTVEGVKQAHRMRFATVTLNPPLDDAIFGRQALSDTSTRTP